MTIEAARRSLKTQMKVEYFEVWSHSGELIAAFKYEDMAHVFAQLFVGSRVVPMVQERK